MTRAQLWCFYLLLGVLPAAGILGVPVEALRGVWGFGANFAALGLCVTLSRVVLSS